MTDGVTPGHRDVSRALGAVLATFRGELDILGVLAAECVSARDVDAFILALLASFARILALKVDDPEQYLLAWVALELELADAEDAGNGDNRAAGT